MILNPNKARLSLADAVPPPLLTPLLLPAQCSPLQLRILGLSDGSYSHGPGCSQVLVTAGC